jgi:hypothetical protein
VGFENDLIGFITHSRNRDLRLFLRICCSGKGSFRHGANALIKFKLIGKKSNRAAIGAKIKVAGKNRDGEKMIRYASVTSGSSFGGNPTEFHLDVENMEIIDCVEVSWPHVKVEVDTIMNLSINSRYIIEEGGKFREIIQPSFSYPLKSHEHNHEHPM